jgi:phosphopantothenate-cysteine ligase/phosphopantothenoylcysteine decarboxylase/phosphopantothenate--cysteine ligase
MNVVVTAGNTHAPIDKVRVITNVFRGRTGARIAAEFARADHRVRLLTSAPESAAADLGGVGAADPAGAVEVRPYATFDDLRTEMAATLTGGGFDALIHSAAVSDYLVDGVFSRGRNGMLTDVAAGKVKSDEPELWLKLVRAPKLIDLVRGDWGFAGVVVKFKLEVGVPDARLLEIAERSRRHSKADLMVANTLEGAAERAWIGPDGPGAGYRCVSRDDLARELRILVERSAAGRRSES